MTETLPQLLAEIDDPELVERVLHELDGHVGEELSADRPSQQDTLSDHYNRYIKRCRNRSPSTIAQYKRTIPDFIEFARIHEISTPADLTVNIIDRYVDELRSTYDADATILTYTKNVRAWLSWLNTRRLCDSQVYAVLNKEDLDLSPTARDTALPEAEAKAIIQRLRRQRRGMHLHVILELTWNGGPRLGDMYSSDVSDFYPEEQALKFRHRPEQGTRLKNGYEQDDTPGDGERDLHLKECTVEALQLYIENYRPDVTDEYGRRPLFATPHGRASRSTLRRWLYEATSCRWGPGDSHALSCDGECDPDTDVCSYSYYPHAIRRGAIVNQLSGGLRKDRASERFNVSIQTLKKHYDPRSKHKAKEDRREAVEDAWSDW